MILIFDIPGRCYTKNSYAAGKGFGRKKGKDGMTDYERAKDWEKRAREHMTMKMLQDKCKEIPLGTSDVKLTVILSIKGRKRADLQNYFKSICDSMNKLVYKDDRQIVWIEGWFHPVEFVEEERVLIVVKNYDQDQDFHIGFKFES